MIMKQVQFFMECLKAHFSRHCECSEAIQNTVYQWIVYFDKLSNHRAIALAMTLAGGF